VTNDSRSESLGNLMRVRNIDAEGMCAVEFDRYPKSKPEHQNEESALRRPCLFPWRRRLRWPSVQKIVLGSVGHPIPNWKRI
jgi:hypothetical protein